MRAALLAHDEVLRTAIEAHKGFLFSHTGDGVVAAFPFPMSAVDAAGAAQRALELPARMGIATGEAELRDGDYFGTVLNRAARVMAAGHRGQILLAESTAGLLSGVDLLDLGRRRLRDVPNPLGLFQVRAPSLPEQFPPLRGVDSNPGNLRPAITSFIGRDAEVTDVHAAVKSHRLATLTGVGGVGKTASRWSWYPADLNEMSVAHHEASAAQRRTDRDPAKKWSHLAERKRQLDIEAAGHAAVADSFD